MAEYTPHTPSPGRRRCTFDCPACDIQRVKWRRRNSKAIKAGVVMRLAEACQRGDIPKGIFELLRKIVVG